MLLRVLLLYLFGCIGLGLRGSMGFCCLIDFVGSVTCVYGILAGVDDLGLFMLWFCLLLVGLISCGFVAVYGYYSLIVLVVTDSFVLGGCVWLLCFSLIALGLQVMMFAFCLF